MGGLDKKVSVLDLSNYWTPSPVPEQSSTSKPWLIKEPKAQGGGENLELPRKMADVESPPVEAITEAPSVLNDTAEAAINGTTGKIPSTPEGMALAYGSLLVMALIPIFVGAFRSVKSHKEQLENSASTGEKPETMTQKDAAMFPIIASCALFGLYVFFQVFSKDHINLLLSVYFFVLGIFALSHMVGPTVTKLIPGSVPKIQYRLHFTQGEGDQIEDVIDSEFSTHDMIVFALSAALGVWYLVKKHWIANNIFGLAFAI